MQFWNRQDYIHQDVFLFLPSCEPRQCQPDFLWYFVEVCCFIQLKIHQKFKFAEIPRTFHLQNDKNKSNLLILLKYFVKFPVRQSISCEQSSQVHGGKDSLQHTPILDSSYSYKAKESLVSVTMFVKLTYISCLCS